MAGEDWNERTPDERREARLVAHLLGELEPAERAELDAELERSPELRAERARLAGVVGLLRDSFGDAERDALSADALAGIDAAARRAGGPARPSAWSGAGSAALRLAATVLLAVGTWAVYRATAGDAPPAPGVEADVAALDPRDAGEAAGGLRYETEEADGAADPRRDALAAADGGGAPAGPPPDAGPGPERAKPAGGAADAARGSDLAFSAVDPDPQLEAGVTPTLVETGGAVLLSEPALGDGGAAVTTGDDAFWLGKGRAVEGESANGFVGAVQDQERLRARLSLAELDKQADLARQQPNVGELRVLRAQEAPAAGYKGPGDSLVPAEPAAPPGSAVAPGAGGGGTESRLRSARKEKAAGAGPSSPGPPAGPATGAVAVPETAVVAGRRALPSRGVAPAAEGDVELGLHGFDLPHYREPLVDLDTDADDFRLGGERLRVDGYASNRLFYAGGERFGSKESARARVELLIRDCTRRPHERPRDMFFRFWGDNPFEVTATDALSTFAVDVDTASYTLARRMLREGYLPEKAAIRTEEFVNWFRPDVPPPVEGTFRVETEMAPSRHGAADAGSPWMLRVALRGREVSESERKPVALTFVVDVSGSMKENGRLELVKHALRLLLSKLDGNDSVALVAFSREARLILPMTSAGARGVVESALFPLSPDGGTNAEAGLKMGYEVALAGFTEGAVNRVVFLSDGVANIGQTDQDRLNADVARHRARGIYLNTVGVGLANHNDVFLEQLANKGDGLCNYVDGPDEARRALVDNFVGALQPIARDVKVQVEFDPDQVLRWRLLGYENRAIADEDFRNDAVDAGEVGSGHQVLALYEVVLTRSGGSGETPLATARVRWKPPYSDRGATPADEEATEIAHPVWLSSAAGAYEQTSPGYRRTVVAAQLAEVLRRSIHARADSLQQLLADARALAAETQDPEVAELADLVERAAALLARDLDPYDALAQAIDEYRRHCYLKAQLEELQETGETLIELEKENLKLQEKIRALLEKRLAEQDLGLEAPQEDEAPVRRR